MNNEGDGSFFVPWNVFEVLVSCYGDGMEALRVRSLGFRLGFRSCALGVADSCTKKGVTQFTDLLSEWSNSQGYCIEIGNGAWDSWFMPFEDQIEIACEKVKNMSELSQGYNIVGLSQ
ncbi:palmitoyl-protein thioesterase 1-like protein isoform X1, partial [Tanacetum coccineum]